MKHTIYKTDDIVQAAFLKVVGYTMDSIELNGTKGTFIFKGVDQPVLDSFDLGNSKVEPMAFNNTIRQLTTAVRRMVPSTS